MNSKLFLYKSSKEFADRVASEYRKRRAEREMTDSERAEQLELELEKQKDKNFDQQRQIGKERLAHKEKLIRFKDLTAERAREQREKDRNKLR